MPLELAVALRTLVPTVNAIVAPASAVPEMMPPSSELLITSSVATALITGAYGAVVSLLDPPEEPEEPSATAPSTARPIVMGVMAKAAAAVVELAAAPAAVAAPASVATAASVAAWASKTPSEASWINS